MIATKNYQSGAVIREMAAPAFPGREIAEIRALRLLAAHPEIGAPRLYAADDSKTLCTGSYFLMETVPGVNFVSVKDGMSEAERSTVYREIGERERRIGEITGERFGILGEVAFDSLHDFFTFLMENLLTDTQNAQVDYCIPHEAILALLQKDKPCFDEVTIPRLCHWDLWDGNVFVKDGHVSGIIDWERTYFAEPLMCDQFLRHTRRVAFLEGQGKTEFTPAEKRRLAWYDLFLFGTMITEEVYRAYEPGSQSDRVRPHFEAAWKELNGI